MLSIFGDGDIFDDVLNENIKPSEDDNQNNEQNEGDNNENDDNEQKDDDKVTQKVEPKKRTVKNPQHRLNVNLLKGPRGISAINEYFKDIKFKGKGHERDDLNNLMKRLEHWSHRLYPKFSFDDSITTIEKLGKKKEIGNYMYKYRNDLLEPEINLEERDRDSDNMELNIEDPTDQFDEMDLLLDQQITLAKNNASTHNNSAANNSLFDQLHTSSFNIDPEECQPSTSSAASLIFDKQKTVTNVLSAEQIARITENRLAAQQKLKQRREQANFELDLSKM